MICVDTNLFRGPRPKSYADLKEKGIRLVVNLETGFHEQVYDDTYEHQDPAVYSIRVVKLKCSNVMPPPDQQVLAFFKTIEERPHPVYVHCLAGVDRTGFMIATYRMQVQGWSFKDAHTEWVRLGRHWWFWWWKYALKTWETT